VVAVEKIAAARLELEVLALEPTSEAFGCLLCPYGVQSEEAKQVSLKSTDRINPARLNSKRIQNLVEQPIASLQQNWIAVELNGKQNSDSQKDVQFDGTGSEVD
jgi:hypothetical protein